MLPKLMSGHVTAYAGDSNFYLDIISFKLIWPIKFKYSTKPLSDLNVNYIFFPAVEK